MDSLQEAERAVDRLRKEMLCGEVGEALGPFSEQHFLAAMAALDLAQRQLALAGCHYAREVQESSQFRRGL